jgi:hypothetical protein
MPSWIARRRAGAVLQQARGGHHDVGAHEQQLERILGGVHAARGGQRGRDAAAQDADPLQRDARVVGVREHQAGHELELLEVDVRAQVAVEEHQAVGTGLDQAPAEVRGRAEAGADLDRQRNAHGLAHDGHEVEHAALELGAARVEVGRDDVGIELDRARAGLLQLAGVARPAAGRAAVEAGADRDRELVAGSPQGLEVGLRPERELAQLRLVVEGFGERIASVLAQSLQRELLVDDLLLEQGRHDGHGGARPLEFAQARERAAHRGGGGDERAGQPVAQVSRAEVGAHGRPSPAGTARSTPASCS